MPVEPSDAEEEYFKKKELEKLRAAQQEAAREMATQEKDRLKELHWMRCPKCGLELKEIDYRGVKVDTCFACGGMFLDYGEAEKVVEYQEPGMLARMMTAVFGKESRLNDE
jgi:Zn-finger nucleic acid-binding protein